VRHTGTMTEEALGTGIFEYSVTFDALTYTVGEYWVECADATGNDRIGLQVTQLALDDLANLMEVSNQLDRISLVFSNIQTTVETLAPLSNLATVVSRLESQVASLTNLPERLDQMDLAMSNRLDQIYGGLDQVVQVSSNLEAASFRLAPLTNLFGTISNIDATIGILTSLTNLPEMITTLDGRMVSLNSLTNMAPILNELSDALQSADLVTMADQVNELSVNLANYQPGSSNNTDTVAMMKSLQEIKTELELQTDMGDRVNLAIKKAQSAASAASKAGTAAQAAKKELGEGRIDEAVNLLTDLRKTLKPEPGEEPPALTAAEFDRQIDRVIRRINELAAQKGAGPLMSEKMTGVPVRDTAGVPSGENIPTGETGGAVAPSDREAIVQLNARLEEVRAMMALLQSLMEQTINKPVVVDWLESGTP
jgi:hypothetical protein